MRDSEGSVECRQTLQQPPPLPPEGVWAGEQLEDEFWNSSSLTVVSNIRAIFVCAAALRWYPRPLLRAHLSVLTHSLSTASVRPTQTGINTAPSVKRTKPERPERPERPTGDATVRGCGENNRWRGGSGTTWPSVSYPGKPGDSPPA